jgi:hypothetical protein
LNDKETEIAQLMALRDAKFEELRRRIRFTIDELSGVLDPLDPRWTAFGLSGCSDEYHCASDWDHGGSNEMGRVGPGFSLSRVDEDPWLGRGL